MKYLTSLATLLYAPHSVAAAGCKALVMSGGGSNGAWEAGVIYGLLHQGDPADFDWNVVSGVSAGSINAAMLSPWDIGNEVKASEWIVDKWLSLENDMIYQQWDLGEMSGIIDKPSFFDTTPGVSTFRSFLDEFPDGFKRHVSVTAADINEG